MFFRLLLLINIFGLVNTLSITEYLFRSEIVDDPSSSSSTDPNNQLIIHWQDILFIILIISLFILLIICLYFQRTVINFIFNFFSKPDENDLTMNENDIILQRISSLKNVNTRYLTVPQPAYLQH